MKRPRKNPVLRDRWIICGRSPKTGRLLYYTSTGTLATRGRSVKFATIEHATKRALKILREHPEVRAYNLFAEKLREPGESGRLKTLSNPSGYARARDKYLNEVDRAAETFQGFTGRPVTHQTKHKTPNAKVGFALGPLVGVIYRASREDDGGTFEYLHRFRKSSQPLLIASDDGKSLVISGGEFQVTEKGIEDR